MDEDREREGVGSLLRWIGADLLREGAVRLAALSACVAVVAGWLAEAPAALRVVSAVAGGASVLVLLVAGLSPWPPRRQWAAIAATGLGCAALTALLVLV